MTVQILSGGAALAVPDKNDTPENMGKAGITAPYTAERPLPKTGKEPVIMTEAQSRDIRRSSYRPRGRRLGFFAVPLIQLVICGALFAAAWAAVSLASAEAAELVRRIIGKFA